VPPLAPFFLAYVGGVLAALPASRDFLFPFALPVALALAALWMTRRQTPARRLIALLFLPLGALLPSVSGGDGPANHVLHHLNDGARATVEGRLYEPPRVFPDRVRFTVELSSLDYDGKRQEVSGRARITLYLLDTPAETVRQLAETTLPQAGQDAPQAAEKLQQPRRLRLPAFPRKPRHPRDRQPFPRRGRAPPGGFPAATFGPRRGTVAGRNERGAQPAVSR